MGRAPLTRAAIDETLEAAGLAPRHRWGQNFLVDGGQLGRIVDLAEIAPGDVVLEVGPGLGGLTERLLDGGATVLAVEIDPGYCALLPTILGAPGALHVVEGDVMRSKSSLSPDVQQGLQGLLLAAERTSWKVVSNLPYQISSPFVAALVGQSPLTWTRAVVTVQKEVAGVLRAGPGSSNYSPLSCLAGLYLSVSRGPRLGRHCFYPQPEVDSEVAVLEPRAEGRVPPAELLPFVRRLFQSRRKALRGTVLDAYSVAGVKLPPDCKAEELLAEADLTPRDRVDGVAPLALERLFRVGVNVSN